MIRFSPGSTTVMPSPNGGSKRRRLMDC